MCKWCHSIIKRESRYTSKVLDLSINLYMRLAMAEHLNLEKLELLKSSISNGLYIFYLHKLLPAELVQSRVWECLAAKYPSVLREGIRASYDAKKSKESVTMELISIKARACKYQTGCEVADTPNKLNEYKYSERVPNRKP